MKVLIVGGGAVASVIARLLAKDRSVRGVACGTNDLARSRPLFKGAGRKVRLIALDAKKKTALARAARGMDLVINASLPEHNERVMRAALAVSADYLDLDSRLSDWKHAEQLHFEARFRKAGRRAIINAGISPGVTNLLAGEAVEILGGRADTIRFRVLEEQDSDRFIPTWSTKVMLDELTADPLIYRGGRFRFVKPLGGVERVVFSGFGIQPTYAIYGDEIATLPLFLKIRNADYKAGGADVEFARVFARDGKLAVALKDAVVPQPLELARLARLGVIRRAQLVMKVEAVRGKRKVVFAVTCPEFREGWRRVPGSTYISYPTAAAASAFALSIGRMRISGVFPAEALPADVRGSVRRKLKRLGIRIRRLPALPVRQAGGRRV